MLRLAHTHLAYLCDQAVIAAPLLCDTRQHDVLVLQVRFQLEQTREGLQRQLAAADGQMHILQARLEDSQAEQQVSALQCMCLLEACGEFHWDDASLHVTMSSVTRVSTAVVYDDLACSGAWLWIFSWAPYCHSLYIALCTGVSLGLPSAVALMDTSLSHCNNQHS